MGRAYGTSSDVQKNLNADGIGITIPFVVYDTERNDIMRAAGILLPVFSLPSDYGIGTMGKEAYKFVDFLEKSGQKYWQVLPIGPTSYGDSPYQSFSTFAGNPYFIDLDMLAEIGLLEKSDYKNLNWGDNPEKIDYALIFETKFGVLRKAYKNVEKISAGEIKKFHEENSSWIDDYALYMSVKNEFELKSWQEWDEDIKFRRPEAVEKYRKNLADEIGFWIFVQYLFFSQWTALRTYAAEKGIKIIGDIPIYVAEDSADAWANPSLFQFDENLRPTAVAGCPPDCFSEDGQLWGNPLYRWEVHKETGFAWWIDRMKAAAKLFDVIRIDHFRGLESYYSIPYGMENARVGEWVKGPDIDFVKTIKREVRGVDIIAEDLGFLTPEVEKLLKKSGFPGMKILEFAFDHKGDSNYLPHNYDKNCVVYTGTHDNETLAGWLEGISRKDKAFIRKYLNVSRKEGLCYGIIRGAWASCANLAVAQMQDFLELDNSARINEPSTLGINWQWRLEKNALTDGLAERINTLTRLYRR